MIGKIVQGSSKIQDHVSSTSLRPPILDYNYHKTSRKRIQNSVHRNVENWNILARLFVFAIFLWTRETHWHVDSTKRSGNATRSKKFFFGLKGKMWTAIEGYKSPSYLSSIHFFLLLHTYKKDLFFSLWEKGGGMTFTFRDFFLFNLLFFQVLFYYFVKYLFLRALYMIFLHILRYFFVHIHLYFFNLRIIYFTKFLCKKL